MIDRTESRIFWLAVLLILAAYFVGVATEGKIFGDVLINILYVITGRNPSTGQFANYPK